MDATNRPLLIPPEFATYAEKHEIFDMLKKYLEELLIEKPADPLNFLLDLIKKDNSDVPQIIVQGPPASGKRSISKLISSRLRIPHIYPEALINQSPDDIRDQALSYTNNNRAVPTELWMKMLGDRVRQQECVLKGFVLEAFPQTREQALAMQALGIKVKHFVRLDAPDTVLIERAAGRRIDPETGDVYHTTFEWPSEQRVIDRLQTVPDMSEEALVHKLVSYHRHIDDLRSCFTPVEKCIDADQPKHDVFQQVMTFLESKPRSVAPHNPRIVLLGPTGSGKAVQAALLASKYNIVNVSCGQLVKRAIADETRMGQAIRPYVEKDMLIPDSLVLSLLKERLSQLDCVTRGWVLHGYPRSREQAEQLSVAGFPPNRMFFLDVPTDSVMERLTLRAVDPISGERYHLLYNPPPTQEIKERLQRHAKDEEQAVRKRLSQWSLYCDELQDYYTQAQRVNADQDPHTVFECIESRIVNPIPKRFIQ